MEYTFEVGFCSGTLCVGVPLHETDSVKFKVDFSGDDLARAQPFLNLYVEDGDGVKNQAAMILFNAKEPELYARIDAAAQTAVRNSMILQYVASADIMLDEEEMRKWFEHDRTTGEFVPEEFIEESWYCNELPDDEEGLFFLWQEFERHRVQEKGIDWLFSRYTLGPDDLSEFEEEIPYFFL